MNHFAPWVITGRCGSEREFEVEYTYEPGRPAKLAGHPDDMTPADGPQIEVIGLLLAGMIIARESWKTLCFDDAEVQNFIQHIHECPPEAAPPDYDRDDV